MMFLVGVVLVTVILVFLCFWWGVGDDDFGVLVIVLVFLMECG